MLMHNNHKQIYENKVGLRKFSFQGWDKTYLKTEEDNLARERIDRAGGGCGRGAGPLPATVGTFGISGIKNSCFNAF